MGAEDNQPDWNRIAEKFDLWLPQIAPVGEALIDALQANAAHRILDMASGTGEPALTLARRLEDKAEIIGIDAAPGMVNVAQKKAEDANLRRLRFLPMPAEKLDFEAHSFDRVLCRFGVMLFEDPLAGLREMHRVLQPGGRFALAVWSTPETMPTLYWSHQAFRGRIPESEYPPLPKVTSLGAPGRMETLLKEAGFREYTVERRQFDYRFNTFDAYWDLVEASEILKQQYDALPPEEAPAIRQTIAHLARDFIREDGQLVVPHEYLLIHGSR